MRLLYSSIIRAICAIAVGALIIEYREETVHWLTIAVGVLFFVSGLISCILYYIGRRNARKQVMYDAEGRPVKAGWAPTFPIVGVGSMLLGVILTMMSSTFITGLMYALSAILILGAVNQYINLAQASRFCRVGLFYWLLPTIILIVAIIMIVKPLEAFASPLFIIGWCMMLYGAAELVAGIKLFGAFKHRRVMEKMAEEAAAMAEEEPKQIEILDVER